ncbi:MAG: DEAD/DEAH box helicase [Proteobacteria bacterium]|nr:DEAD/DEAH box helicase [Pseudomonadota bacterium]
MKKFIQEIRESEELRTPGSIYHRHLPGFAGDFREIPSWFSAEIRLRLEAQGIKKLFSHQVAALDLIRFGENVVVSTPTASGKSLIYNLAAAEAARADPGSRALYLFPLKALEQDQVRALGETFGGILTADIYDGDTPQSQRTRIRKKLPGVLVTNPDMLHAGILPYHANWSEFWPGLKYVVLDELHTYRGIFGSHVSQVLRRLRRVAEHYGSRPQFLFFSATIGNPGELAGALSGLPFREVSESGAPRAGRHFLFCNPSASP